MTDATVTDAAVTRPAPRPWPVVVLGLLAAVVILELAAGPALRPARGARHEAAVLAIPGVAGLVHDAQADPTEITQVAQRQHPPSPLALPAQALVDGLLLLGVLAGRLPFLLGRPGVARPARLGSFLGSLAVLVGAVAVVVVAAARMRYLVALYLSPPFGTLSYLLLYSSFPRGRLLMALTILMALKVGAGPALFPAHPAPSPESRMAGLALTSVAATVVTTFGYAVAPTALAGIADAMAAAAVALAAVVWAGLVVSGTVRRVA